MAVTKRICTECKETFTVPPKDPDQTLCPGCAWTTAAAQRDMAAAVVEPPLVPITNEVRRCRDCNAEIDHGRYCSGCLQKRKLAGQRKWREKHAEPKPKKEETMTPKTEPVDQDLDINADLRRFARVAEFLDKAGVLNNPEITMDKIVSLVKELR